MENRTDTIAAVATPPGCGAIGVVRVSGPLAFAIGDRVFARPGFAFASAEPREAVYGVVSDPRTGERLDDAVLLPFRAPHSYTGEDVLELSCHGGHYLVSCVLDAVLWCGARPAGPGEFTYRAYLAGKLDLAEAEAVADLIQAQSAHALRAANRLRSGELSDVVRSLRSALLDAASAVEAAIETDNEDPSEEIAVLGQDLARLEAALSALRQHARAGRAVRHGFRVAIVGRPNVGKSALFNALVRRSRSIVAPTPGTTRDPLDETVEIGGLAFAFSDTAGLRAPRGVVEAEGIARATRCAAEADGVLLVLDVRRGPAPADVAACSAAGERLIACLLNKTDLVGERCAQRAAENLARQAPGQVLMVSATRGTGVAELEDVLVERALGPGFDADAAVLTHERHARAVEAAATATTRALSGLSAARALDLVAMDLRDAVLALGSVVGGDVGSDVLQRIFGRFCIGK